MLSSLVPSSFTCSAARVAIRRPFVAAAPTQRPIRRAIRCAAAADEYQTLSTSPMQPIMDKGELQLHKLANMAGVYAVYDKEGSLQYIGLSRKIDASISNHMTEIPELTHSVKYWSVENTSRESLVAAWKLWIEEAAEQMGNIPPGNAPGETRWQSRKAAPMKKEIKLTAGKPISGITIEQLVDQVVKTNKIVAFVKGTRGQPQCGFSNKMMQILNESKADYEVVNVLDDVHNPGLRDAIKTYSQWPTIPQLYIKGEFVGGADICEQMHTSGELQKLLQEQ